MSHIRKGDNVVVIAGACKGQNGEVLKVFTPKSVGGAKRAVVQNVNFATKHQKPSQVSQGGKVKFEKSISISNLSHIDPKSKKPTRTSIRVSKDGVKQLVAKKSGEVIRDVR